MGNCENKNLKIVIFFVGDYNMVNSILLAGGKVKNTLGSKLDKFFYKQIYKENYLWGDYKPLKEIELELNGERKKRFLIEYALNALSNSEMIDKIVVVGEKTLLEDKIDFSLYKNIKLVQQGNSLIENAEIGYFNSSGGGKFLFAPVDTPLVGGKEIDNFIKKCENYKDYDIYCAVTSKEVLECGDNYWDRPYFWVMDEESSVEKEFDKYGRRGFRLGNFFFADPNKIGNVNHIDDAYSVRKLLNPLNMFRLGCFMFPEAKKYWFKQLSKQDLEKKVSKILGTRFKFVETDSPTFSLDVDAYEDIQSIEKYFNSKV